VIIPKVVRDDLAALPAKHFRQVISKIEALKLDPRPADRRPMTDYPDVYRMDSGEYRIGWTEQKTATEHVLTIELVDRRNDKQFYKAIKRRRLHR
jgi:mRNA interferase RelE/StbE